MNVFVANGPYVLSLDTWYSLAEKIIKGRFEGNISWFFTNCLLLSSQNSQARNCQNIIA